MPYTAGKERGCIDQTFELACSSGFKMKSPKLKAEPTAEPTC